jgi:beta-glucosidase
LNAGPVERIYRRLLKYAGKDAPKYTADELKIIASPIDFVGLNIYAPPFCVAVDA